MYSKAAKENTQKSGCYLAFSADPAIRGTASVPARRAVQLAPAVQAYRLVGIHRFPAVRAELIARASCNAALYTELSVIVHLFSTISTKHNIFPSSDGIYLVN
jgi:hypothetical protein